MHGKTKIMLHITIIWAILAGAAEVGWQPAMAKALPQSGSLVIPARIFGKVQVDRAAVPASTEITAWIDNKLYATAHTTVTQGLSIYVIEVPGDDPNTPNLIENGPNGKTILFKINSTQANETAVWHSAALIELNLTATTVTVIPTPIPTETTLPAAVYSAIYYRVQPGDTLSKIAQHYSVTISALVQANGLRSADNIYVGQQLYIPEPVQAFSCASYYYVKRGDTLAGIAAYFGIEYYRLAQANGISNPNYIVVNQRLCIPNVYAGSR
jgi:LysM repeat protein